MADTPNQRKLAAILAADVAGYTRLVEQDTEATVTAWKAARDDVITPLIESNQGKIIKFTGDGFLVEFPSVEDVVSCAVLLQEKLAPSTLKFRMGIHLGDVTHDGVDVHGEGVNIAARLESMANPGGITISGLVYELVRNRIQATYEDWGEHDLKHVSQPIRIYSIKLESETESTVTNKRANPEGRASIAILPFDNMSGDSEQEYFCDGVVEDIITEISKFRWLSVIARNSTFTYKGKSTDAKTIGQELGVRYVVEGSLRKAGERIRINAQLIDSTNGSHIWAQRYDRQLIDIFDLQDEITQTLIAAIEPEIAAAERSRARKKPTDNLGAWELYHQALWYRYRYTAEAYDVAERLLKEAVAMDPNFAPAYAVLGWLDYARVVMGYSGSPEKHLKQGARNAKTAIELDDREAMAYCTLNGIQTMTRQYESALKNIDYAIELNPNHAQAHMLRAMAMNFSLSEDFDDIRRTAEAGMRLSPKDPMTWNALQSIGWAHSREGNIEIAVEYFLAASRLPVTTHWVFLNLAGSLKILGREGEAEAALATAVDMSPTLSIEVFQRIMGEDWLSTEFGAQNIEALRELGLPENHGLTAGVLPLNLT
jgi:adenylate cyclase